MQRKWSRYLRLIFAFLLTCFLAGLWLGFPLIGLLAGLVILLLWTLTQTKRLYDWLSNPNASFDAPDSIGFWGEIFDSLHRLHQNHLRTRDQLETRINRVQESTNAMQDAVVMTDSSGAMEWWNESAEYLLGLRRETDRGQPIHNLIRTPAFKRYFQNRDFNGPLDMRSPARPHLHLQIQISLFGDDDRLIVARDVTRLFQLEKMRQDFVSNVSHEMRTPLTVISGYLETLQDNTDQVPPTWQRAINTMSGQASRMEALVTDLILLAKLETGENHINNATTDMRALLEQIRADAVALSADKQHDIKLKIGARHFLDGDKDQLRSACSNIIFNAVKYTPAGGKVHIHWHTDREGAHLAVRDSGIGVDPAHIPRLTERFYRADPSRHQTTGGTGLGLAIVKHVLLNHDGRLDINSTPGEGSEFICHFPRERIVESPALDN